MEIGIVGLPRSGKTTVFNAVTRGKAQVATYGSAQAKPNVGVAKVPDERLDVMVKMFNPRKTVHAEVSYVDIPAPPEGFGKTKGISGEFLNFLQRTDALMVVTRGFEDPSVTHVADTVDPFRDIDTMMFELTFSDLEMIERRLLRMADRFKSAKQAERDQLNKEKVLIERLKEGLEAGKPIRGQEMTKDEEKTIEGFRFLTQKAVIVVLNAGEEQAGKVAEMEQKLAEHVKGEGVRGAVLLGKLEMELAQMDPADEEVFRKEMGVGESGLGRMVKLSYEVIGLNNFLTVGEDECRAWEIPAGISAQKAAGRIHSDIERGFIRAEVVAYKDLVECGSLVEAKKRGVLRMEGKEYIVKDGDIINFLFNV
ncbi:MAG: redox-regulated ATPase YchF [SAR202 cluster bacterium]|nr:redox-regulated ATPase YchF [SAR202 cluster bacterium]